MEPRFFISNFFPEAVPPLATGAGAGAGFGAACFCMKPNILILTMMMINYKYCTNNYIILEDKKCYEKYFFIKSASYKVSMYFSFFKVVFFESRLFTPS
jgi:hypothetical protein